MSWSDAMTVEVPEGTSGAMSVERFTIEENSLENLRLHFQGRGTKPGTYTRLVERRGNWADVWMSDTDAEKRDHAVAAWMIRGHHNVPVAERVLLGGLGLGMVLRVALLTPGVRHVDVVELSSDVIALAGPHYEAMAAANGVGLAIHHDDMFSIRWSPRTRWNVAWFDVWGDISSDALSEMTALRRSYGRRTDWNDCWAREDMLRQRRLERASGWC